MWIIKKKITQIGYSGRCITLPKMYLDSLEEQGIRIKEMWMKIHPDNHITLIPIVRKKKSKTKKK